MKKIRSTALAAAPLALALALVLAGCAGGTADTSMPGMGGGSSAATSPPTAVKGDFNAADSMFATMMIPHHQQAVEMSDMILGKTGIDPRVRDLAQQIKDAQAPEIEQMQSWLTAWGVDADSGMNGMEGMHDGMMSQGDMTALDAADGADASRLFLEQMIVHHQGAIDMAQTEIADGKNPDALALAQAIVKAQTAEIASMQELLTQL